MTTDILFKAILSMDAYNRGYNAGIKFGNELENNSLDNPGIQIGTATILDNSSDVLQNTDAPISFYGIAYETSTGETIISYRGTDNLFLDGFYGYSVGFGNADSAAQADMAFDFYNQVNTALNNGNYADPRAGNISLTGHSLGGGLAGLVAGVYDKEATLFDNMTFEAAANDNVHYKQERCGS